MAIWAANTVLKSQGNAYTQQKLLGAGCQGEVYEALDREKRRVAVKLYFPNRMKQIKGGFDRQRRIVEALVQAPCPDARLAWPRDFIPCKSTFGFAMDLAPQGYVSMKRFLSEPRYHEGRAFGLRVNICRGLCEVFERVHLAGYSYGDVSDNNIWVDPKCGGIFVIDNDNVVVNGEEANILGTPEFIAPQLFAPKAAPDRLSDLYALAVLLFKILFLSHPLLGKREPTLLGKKEETELFVKHPLYIFDPKDAGNRPDPKYHANALFYRRLYPGFLNDLFTRAFTEGLFNPPRRVYEPEWAAALENLCGLRACCPKCAAENFYDPEAKANRCWKCGQSLAVYRIRIKANIVREVVLSMDPPTVLTAHSLYHNELRDAVATVVKGPKGVPGLKNLGERAWMFQRPEKSPVQVQPGQAVPLIGGSRIVFDAERKVRGEILK